MTIETFEAELVSEARGRKEYKKTDRQKTVTVPYYNEYIPVRRVKLPVAYILTVNDPEITGFLKDPWNKNGNSYCCCQD